MEAMVMKKVRKPASGRPPLYPVDKEARNGLKMQGLMRDFSELQIETEDLKQHLQKSKQRKLTLLAEVQFLHRRLKYLTKNPVQIANSGKPLHPSIKEHKRVSMQMDKRKYKEKEFFADEYRELVDLNQISLLRDEEVGDFQVPLKPLKMSKKSKSYQRAVENMTNSSSLPFYKDVARESGRTGKRKVTRLDKVALLA